MNPALMASIAYRKSAIIARRERRSSRDRTCRLTTSSPLRSVTVRMNLFESETRPWSKTFTGSPWCSLSQRKASVHISAVRASMDSMSIANSPWAASSIASAVPTAVYGPIASPISRATDEPAFSCATWICA